VTDLKVMKWPGKFRPASPLSAGIRGGDILWLAGQVPTDPDTGEAVMAGLSHRDRRHRDCQQGERPS
jgi:enamine deaminase RidA (YjgF/YER057c/UK114 family)